MALVHLNYFSEVLGLCTSAYVILPETTQRQIGPQDVASGGPYRTLYLLHGLSDDHTIWLRRTSIERYAAPLSLAVVMPAANRSFYADMEVGPRYWTHISEEVPAVCHAYFPLSLAREDTYVAGLSMGGYGAFKHALKHPGRYAAAGSFSGALNIAGLAGGGDEGWRREWEHVFGDLEALPGSDHDLLHLADVFAESDGPKPRLFQWCGTEDFLYRDNLLFRDHATSLGLDLTYEEGPGGHSWDHWDTQIQRFLEWLDIGPKDNGR